MIFIRVLCIVKVFHSTNIHVKVQKMWLEDELKKKSEEVHPKINNSFVRFKNFSILPFLGRKAVIDFKVKF